MWKRALGYGALLAVGAAALQGLTYQRLSRPWAVDGLVLLVAAAFLALGVWVGVQLWHRSPTGRKAVASARTADESRWPQASPDAGPGRALGGAPEPQTQPEAALAAPDAPTVLAALPAPEAPDAPDGPPTAPLLSARELTVLHQLAAGLSNKEIAQRLHLSPHTVKTHVAHVFEKLGARRRTEAIHKARAWGIVR